ncbi:MAG: aspartate--ammonia ligase [Oscillospiraceae bacterium]|nr:aspartate--ammonia ligase [Oscillospiraceae bacterium]
MAKIVIPEGYKTPLPIYDTQCAIEFIKRNFQENLCNALNLRRVSAPLFVEEGSGLNDNLNGYERPVSFDIPDVGTEGQVVHSLAKWKRYALQRYNFFPGRGLYTDMNAIRRDEELDNIHSVYVDQWDWETVITRENRTREYLIDTVQRIVNCAYVTNEMLKIQFPQLHADVPRDLLIVTTQELEDRYPELGTGSQRETAFLRENPDKAVFLMQIGGALRSGKPHDGRAPDYDDWDLNGDILFWNEVLQRSFEVSSMGIRVDEESLLRQLKIRGCEERKELPFHRALLAGELPLSIGGGIGQSRLCMLMMGCAHIGEVQCSIWDQTTREACQQAGVMLL